MPRSASGRADHAAFGDRRMRQQRGLHFRPGDVVARRDDHVVGARLIPEVAVGIHQVGVAGDVPAVLHVLASAARRRDSGSRSGPAPRDGRRCRAAARCRRRRSPWPRSPAPRLPVEPARTSLLGEPMKMCIISVAPMPSRILMPVAFSHASNVAFGSASPADTQLRSD